MSEQVTLTIDGKPVTVAKGTNVLEAAKQTGCDISAFCYHPGLSIAACCRQCLVSIEKQPKLAPSCQTTVAEGMVVHTKDANSTAARRQMLEFTLVNHPIDCPICDKAGECTLQKLYVENNNQESRVDTPKVHKRKVVDVGPHIVLDQERCILCTRCIRVCDEVAGQKQLVMANRGDHEVLTTAPGETLSNPYSLNTVDVCPVGALTAKDFRFTMRAWELSSSPSVCNGCATGCNVEVHHKDNQVWRMVPRENLQVNQYWMCDEGRFTYKGLRDQRLATPTIKGLPASWDRAVATASEMIASTEAPRIAVVLSARATNEDNFALAKFAKLLGAGHVFIAAAPKQSERADGRLRDADVNANTRGVTEMAHAMGLAAKDASHMEGAGFTLAIVLGVDGTMDAPASALRGVEVVAFSAHDGVIAKTANVALPIAAWAEAAGSITNRQGRTQRMHVAVAAPGSAVPGWDALGRVATAAGQRMSWSAAKDVFAELCTASPFFASMSWSRDVRPVHLRFAASRG